jgi:hypothetical protein
MIHIRTHFGFDKLLDAQSNLHSVSFMNVSGHIVLRLAGGVLAPGQSVLVTIRVPFNACTQGLFFFQGPINIHTITLAC